MNYLFVLHDPPYGTERTYNGIRWARQMLDAGHQVRVFNFADAVISVTAGQKVPNGFYNLAKMTSAFTGKGGQIGNCGACMDARGMGETSSSTARTVPRWPSWPTGRPGPTRSSTSDIPSAAKEPEAMSKTVVVLGAGVGGLTAATELRKTLPAQDRIVLIDRGFDGTLGLSLLWVLRGWRSTEQVAVRPSAAALPGVDWVTGQIERIDLDSRTIDCGPAGTIGYDALVIALGASLDLDRLTGLSAALEAGVAGQFYTADGAADLHNKVEALETGRVMVLVASTPFKCPRPRSRPRSCSLISSARNSPAPRFGWTCSPRIRCRCRSPGPRSATRWWT